MLKKEEIDILVDGDKASDEYKSALTKLAIDFTNGSNYNYIMTMVSNNRIFKKKHIEYLKEIMRYMKG